MLIYSIGLTNFRCPTAIRLKNHIQRQKRKIMNTGQIKGLNPIKDKFRNKKLSP